MHIRDECPQDAGTIAAITAAAFEALPYSSGTESRIIEALRAAGALTVSLVAERDGEIEGHIAFSPVQIDGRNGPWFGLGPVSVRPDVQGQGIGTMLIRSGLERLRSIPASLCVVLGDPRYYGRFGFRHDPRLTYDFPIAEAFQCLALSGSPPSGIVTYNPAFDAS
ncbi:GCN5 family N-acetyltransferase [Novosphingobium endophyticum]|uniref:GCN5 family N-acetyltransferase n=1 Tax=Novosphingobium endophyticum TaxID=1955250 RepID=A0A916TUZ6_9SPHN|nr:N-acetyltransferase [Novosphingobium endophyticum]GGC09824.1 GCN5 family N-acetyltransferase [Novosphingobium endophyticum]